MEHLIDYFNQQIPLEPAEKKQLETIFVPVELPAKSVFIEDGKTARYLYFLASGIVKGYKNKDGKIIVEHLVEQNSFVTSLESFFSETAATDCFETITPCQLYKISKADFDLLKSTGEKWNKLIEEVTNENLRCKLERVNDFQTLTAKERYLKFIEKTPQLALNVSVEDTASFLGIEPPSLSRIRRQIIN